MIFNCLGIFDGDVENLYLVNKLFKIMKDMKFQRFYGLLKCYNSTTGEFSTNSPTKIQFRTEFASKIEYETCSLHELDCEFAE